MGACCQGCCSGTTWQKNGFLTEVGVSLKKSRFFYTLEARKTEHPPGNFSADIDPTITFPLPSLNGIRPNGDRFINHTGLRPLELGSIDISKQNTVRV